MAYGTKQSSRQKHSTTATDTKRGRLLKNANIVQNTRNTDKGFALNQMHTNYGIDRSQPLSANSQAKMTSLNKDLLISSGLGAGEIDLYSNQFGSAALFPKPKPKP